MPITNKLDDDDTKLYEVEDLSTLRKRAVEGEVYTMNLKVTSTCEKPVEIGFPRGSDCWFCSIAAPNAVDSIITVTDKWDLTLVPELWLESSTKCAGKSLTIHQIQLVEGPENCFSSGMFYYGMKIPFSTKTKIAISEISLKSVLIIS